MLSGSWLSMVKIPYEVSGHRYYAEVYLKHLIEAKEKEGFSGVERLVEAAVEEDFQQNIYYSYDIDELTEKIDKKYGTNISIN